jgi:wyosine [tRNA(Phe)-imidazoG37] synthetase (radical SAM superfamily)
VSAEGICKGLYTPPIQSGVVRLDRVAPKSFVKLDVLHLNIRMKTYCSKSWTDININFYNRTLRHCCKSAEYLFPEQLTVDFINNSSQIQTRRIESLQGVAHADCASCWKSMAATGSSYRDWMNVWDDHYIATNRAQLNDAAVKIIDIELDTTCDMSCIYCFADTSSKIAQEEGVELKSKFNDQDYAVFKQWIAEYLSRTDHLHDDIVFNFLGGEPTASKRFYDLIAFIESAAVNSTLDITIALCTNANTKPYLMKKLQSAIDNSRLLWSISVSNEAFGQDAELVRWGLDWERFENTIVSYMSNPKITMFSLTPSLNALNLKTFPAYVKWIHDLFDTHCNNKALAWYGNYIEHPKELDIANLPKDHIVYLDQVLAIVADYKHDVKYRSLAQFEQFIESMKQRIGSINNPNHKEELAEFLNRKQRVKKTDKLSILLKNIE